MEEYKMQPLDHGDDARDPPEDRKVFEPQLALASVPVDPVFSSIIQRDVVDTAALVLLCDTRSLIQPIPKDVRWLLESYWSIPFNDNQHAAHSPDQTEEQTVERQKQPEGKASRPGRPPSIENAPEEALCILNSILDFTADESNRTLAFQTQRIGVLSMCRFVHLRLSDIQVQLSEKGVESRILITFSQIITFGISLPTAETNVGFYFDNRQIVAQAANTVDIFLKNSAD